MISVPKLPKDFIKFPLKLLTWADMFYQKDLYQ